VVIIARGRIVADAKPEELERRSPLHNAVRLTLERERVEEASEAIRTLNTVREVQRLEEMNGVATLLVLPVDGADLGAQVSQLLHGRGIRIERLAVERGRLDDVFRALTQGPSA
jgi:ABC-2 type transport system ATP-binding protein